MVNSGAFPVWAWHFTPWLHKKHGQGVSWSDLMILWCRDVCPGRPITRGAFKGAVGHTYYPQGKARVDRLRYGIWERAARLRTMGD
ncbi:hypothetical protein DSCA_55520 [Desulfosarcina alkanivorans]|uniref:Uncharacterized protein n=1 Tax=Desulfosarcina alkanivorans TaxID=571177 RepID=A0A5K7YPA7_9BACT|nr:hypothetical protein DSCA_55520 [Desulfosarcina alkanivorans]